MKGPLENGSSWGGFGGGCRERRAGEGTGENRQDSHDPDQARLSTSALPEKFVLVRKRGKEPHTGALCPIVWVSRTITPQQDKEG